MLDHQNNFAGNLDWLRIMHVVFCLFVLFVFVFFVVVFVVVGGVFFLGGGLCFIFLNFFLFIYFFLLGGGGINQAWSFNILLYTFLKSGILIQFHFSKYDWIWDILIMIKSLRMVSPFKSMWTMCGSLWQNDGKCKVTMVVFVLWL